MKIPFLLIAWVRLLRIYLVAFGCSFLAGLLLITCFGVPPEKLFLASSTRLSYVIPIFDAGVNAGVDQGIIIFLWNSSGALITLSFLYLSGLFNPKERQNSHKLLRNIFCGKHRMKLLCFLPGCKRVEEESVRRLYVWLMIPLLGMLLLGIESGLIVATGKDAFGSYLASVMALLPHGIIEIPAVSLAGAVTFSGHLLIKKEMQLLDVPQLFDTLKEHKRAIPVGKICTLVVCGLAIAGAIEAHFTPYVLSLL